MAILHRFYCNVKCDVAQMSILGVSTCFEILKWWSGFEMIILALKQKILLEDSVLIKKSPASMVAMTLSI